MGDPGLGVVTIFTTSEPAGQETRRML